MDYSLSDVMAMRSPDVSLDQVRKMPMSEEQKKLDAAQLVRLRDNASDMSGTDRFLSGMGKAVSDLGSGVRQLGGMVGIGDPKAIQAEVDDTKRRDASLMNTGAGLAGNVAGNVAMTVLPAGAAMKGAEGLGMARTALAARQLVNPTSYTGAIAAGTALGGLSPVASDESRGANMALGGAAGLAGQALVNGFGRIAQPVKNALEPAQQKAIDTLRAAGVPLDLAQLTGSPTWGRIRSALGDNLFTMGGQAAKEQAQKDAFTSAALTTAGASGKATSDVMGANQARLNGVFKDVLDRNHVAADPAWITPLADVHSAALENEKQPVANIINRIFGSMDPQTGAIPGQVAYGIKKDLDRMAMSSDSTQNYLARQARSALMDGMNSSLSGADQKAFSEARGQMANQFKLEGAISKDGAGTISAPQLANIMGQKANRAASIYGKGPQDLVELAQAGKQVLGDKTPNSGTAARLIAQTALPGLALGAADAVNEYRKEDGTALGALTSGAKVAGLAFAAPKAAQFILNSPRISSALADGVKSPVLRGLLESPAENAVVGQGVRALPALAGRGLLMTPTMSYAEYLKAYDEAKTKADKIELGRLYESQLPALQK